MAWHPLVFLWLGAAMLFRPGYSYSAYLSESWAMLSGRPAEPSCVGIPKNFSLCHGIDYSQMRLPNLLDHETMHEATEQAVSWVPLLRLNCHPDTQLFLCSLFAPVCLDRPIFPCRSLCETVKHGCENRMKMYGFPWPEMLKCEKFPLAHDMCIQPRSHYETSTKLSQLYASSSPVESSRFSFDVGLLGIFLAAAVQFYVLFLR